MNDFLVQKISLLRPNGETYEVAGYFDLSFLKEFTYIETLDLSGPKLILKMHDPVGYLKDILSIKEKELIEVSLSVQGWMAESMTVNVRFVIATMPIQGQYITFNCFEERIWKLKQPHRTGRIFPKTTGVQGILKSLFPGTQIEADPFPNDSDYHILPGTRPTKMLREMAHEKGAVLFVKRNKVYMKRIATLKAALKAEPGIVYYHNESKQPYQIMKFERLNGKPAIKDAIDRHYVGWDMVKGVFTGGNSSSPIEYIGKSTKQALDNHILLPMPAVDLIMIGNGKLYPGLCLGIKWQTDNPFAAD